jgi:polysaccharide chain length determinant protein (PEP-CTERM system associated)
MLPGKKLTPDVILRVLLRRRWLIVTPFFLGVMGSLLYSRTVPDRFESNTLLQVVPQRVPDSYVRSTVTAEAEERIKALSEQVMSRSQLERIIQELNLYPDLRQAMPMEDVVQAMNRSVLIQPIVNRTRWPPSVDAFRVRFTYTDPVLAQRVVERVARTIIDENSRDRSTLAESTSTFMDSQLADARRRLEEQEKKLKEFRERNSGRLPTQMQTNMQAITNTQMQLQALVESTARDRDRKAMLERLAADAAADLSTSIAAPITPSPAPPQGDPTGALPASATPAQRLEAARTMLAQLQLKLKPEHPDVIRTKRVVRDLERQVAAEEAQQPLTPNQVPTRPGSADEQRKRESLRQMRAEIDSLGRQIEFKESEERRLRAQMADYQGRLEAVPGLESTWIALTRDYDTLQATYRDLLTKTENSKIAANLEERQIGEQFRIVDPARASQRPISPNRLMISGGGAAIGLGLSLLLLGLLEYGDSTMRTEEDVLGALSLPVLALVPYVSTASDRVREKRKRVALAAAVAVMLLATGGVAWWLELWRYAV